MSPWKEVDLTVRDSIMLFTLGLAMPLLACGDDDGEAEDAGLIDAEAGAGGRAGADAGGATGGNGSSCPEPEHQDLEEWCKGGAKACELSFEARRALFCGELQCSRPSCGVSESANTCGGRSIVYFRGVDIYSARYHYDRDGTLIGVSDRPSQPSGCTASRVVYGMNCEPLASNVVDCADGGLDDAGS